MSGTSKRCGPPRVPWEDVDYAFEEAGDRFQAFVIPNALIEAGDVFTVEITFDDGTTGIYSRMTRRSVSQADDLGQWPQVGVRRAGVGGLQLACQL